MNAACQSPAPAEGGACRKNLLSGQTMLRKGGEVMEKDPKQDKVMKKAKEMSQFQAAQMDPDGSWTGQPLDLGEVPVQDVDDL